MCDNSCRGDPEMHRDFCESDAEYKQRHWREYEDPRIVKLRDKIAKEQRIKELQVELKRLRSKP